jgi:hypothetical protein
LHERRKIVIQHVHHLAGFHGGRPAREIANITKQNGDLRFIASRLQPAAAGPFQEHLAV